MIIKIKFKYYIDKDRLLKPKNDYVTLSSVHTRFTDETKRNFEKTIPQHKQDYFDVEVSEAERKILVVERLSNNRIGRVGFYSKIHANYPLRAWVNPISFNRYSWGYQLKRGDSISELLKITNEY